jgi:hypothetical protein
MAAPRTRKGVSPMSTATARTSAPPRPPACPCCATPIDPELALEAVTFHARARPRSERVARRRGELWAEVAVYLAEHPGASGRAVYAAIGGRKQDVLRAVREVRKRFPSPGNRAQT